MCSVLLLGHLFICLVCTPEALINIFLFSKQAASSGPYVLSTSLAGSTFTSLDTLDSTLRKSDFCHWITVAVLKWYSAQLRMSKMNTVLNHSQCMPFITCYLYMYFGCCIHKLLHQSHAIFFVILFMKYLSDQYTWDICRAAKIDLLAD